MEPPREISPDVPGVPDRLPSTRVAEAFCEHRVTLRAVAREIMRRERIDHTLQPTALVHEAYLRLAHDSRVAKHGERYFKVCIASECRRILAEYERKRRARLAKLSRHKDNSGPTSLAVIGRTSLLELHDAIEELTKRNERMGRIVDLRVFGGLTLDQISEALGVSTRTINKEWRFAQAWLKRELI